MERSWIVFEEIVAVPAVDKIPFILPVCAAFPFVVLFVTFAIVLELIVTVPVPPEFIPYTLCALPVLAELALMLFAVEVLPIRLLFIVVVPDVEVLLIPVK
jgi:hypothetical protein